MGTTGVYVDNSGRYYFGKAATTTPDVSIARDSTGQISVLDNGSNYKNIKAARGLFTLRTGYTLSQTFSSLGNYDFVAKEHMTVSNISDLQDSLNSVRNGIGGSVKFRKFNTIRHRCGHVLYDYSWVKRYYI